MSTANDKSADSVEVAYIPANDSAPRTIDVPYPSVVCKIPEDEIQTVLTALTAETKRGSVPSASNE